MCLRDGLAIKDWLKELEIKASVRDVYLDRILVEGEGSFASRVLERKLGVEGIGLWKVRCLR